MDRGEPDAPGAFLKSVAKYLLNPFSLAELVTVSVTS